jgi:Choline/ethanolamine kinase
MTVKATTEWSDRFPAPWTRPKLSLPLKLLKGFLALIPQRIKPLLYNIWARISVHIYSPVTPNVFHLPFGLALKIAPGPSHAEADALRFINTMPGVHTPHLLDSVPTQEKHYLLTTWVEGDCMADVWDELTLCDKEKIVNDLRHQLSQMRLQTRSSTARICNASSGPIDDPRVPWIAREDPRTFSNHKEFAEEVWPGDREDLRPILRPVMERSDVPIVFSHGDILPKNLIFPESLDHWRSGSIPICIIDWEYAGWMPDYWDPLKMTWMECERDTEWLQMARGIFPECDTELDADWEWRSRSRITLI